LEDAKPDLIEVRLDYSSQKVNLHRIRSVIDIPLIGTVRDPIQGGLWRGSEQDRIRLLLEASEGGFDYIDIETTTKDVEGIIDEVRKTGSKVILSHHDFLGTPTQEAMQLVLRNAQTLDCDYCKIVGTATSSLDNLPYMNFLVDNPGNIAFGMGEIGTPSRVMCPIVGGAWAYASSTKKNEVASGQLTIEDLRKIYRLMGVER